MTRPANAAALGSDLKDAAWLAWPETQQLFAALGADGHETRAVGGAVRDTLIGRPVREVDLATTALPETVMALAERADLKAVPTGIEHGTVTVVVDHKPFEVTTLRRDTETYGRHAKVAFTDDWAADAARRDFTMNAIYADADGTLYDPLGGCSDLAARRIRFIGDADARIHEDYLRILRFFRFNAEYAAPPFDEAGLTACVRGRDGLARLAPERVHGEVARLLAATGVLAALEAMFDYGLLVDVLGGAPYLARIERLTAIEAAAGTAPDAMLRLAALAVAVPEDAERLAARFRLSNAERQRLTDAAVWRGLFEAGDENAARIALYRLGPDTYRDRVRLAWAASGDAADNPAWAGLTGLPERWQAPEFPLSGADILTLGVPTGPQVGAVLGQVEEAWIAAGFSGTREDLLARAREIAE